MVASSLGSDLQEIRKKLHVRPALLEIGFEHGDYLFQILISLP